MELTIIQSTKPDFNNDKDFFVKQTKEFLNPFYTFLEDIKEKELRTIQFFIGEAMLNDHFDDIVYNAYKANNTDFLKQLDYLIYKAITNSNNNH